MRQYLSAQQVQAATQIELNEVVDPLVIKHIKESDPNPEIRLYSIGHEGKSNLHLPGIGNATFTWIQAAVRAIADKLKLGTAVFDRHDPDTNLHTGRTQIGQVVGKMIKKIGDRLSTLAAIHIFPEFKSRPLDVASIEADIEFGHDEHIAWPTNINSVSGIALSNSGIDSPGFPGATLLGAVQAYVQAFAGEFGDNKMNQSDVKAAIMELKLSPSDLFSVEDVTADKKVRTNLQEAATRLGKERDTGRERIAELENQNAEKDKKLLQHDVQSKSASIFDSILADPERKLDDKAKIFVRRGLKDFESTAENEDALKVDAGKFVDESVKEYGELAKDVFGVDTKTIIGNPSVFKLKPEQTVDGQQQTTQTPKQPDLPATLQDKITEEMDPNTNPLIAGGKAAEEAQKT